MSTALEQIQQLQAANNRDKRSGIGAVWSNTTSAVSSTFKVVERFAVSAESLAESAEFNAELTLQESAEEYCKNAGLLDDASNPYKGAAALAVARLIRGR
jgi:hypothetical protein